MKKSVFAVGRVSVSDDLELVPMAAEHAEGCFRACQDEEIQRWLPLPNPYPLELAREWCGVQAESFRASGQGIHYALVSADGFQGCISLKNTRWHESTVEIGYWLAPWGRGRGYMTDAVDTLTRHALSLGFERVELRIGTGNVRSAAVAAGAGYSYEGILRRAGYVHSGQIDLAMYSFVRGDEGQGRADEVA